MSKPDWKDAPEWANVLLYQSGFNGTRYCWAGYHANGSKAQWHENIGRDNTTFHLIARPWDFLERRP